MLSIGIPIRPQQSLNETTSSIQFVCWRVCEAQTPQLTPQAAQFLEERRDIAQNNGNAVHFPIDVAQLMILNSTEYPALSRSLRGRQQLSCTVATFRGTDSATSPPNVGCEDLRHGTACAGLTGRRGNASELDSGTSRFPHHKVKLWAFARPFRSKLNHRVWPTRNPCVQGFETFTIGHLQRKMVQPDIPTPIEWHATVRVFDSPKCHDTFSIRHERRRITLILT